jgi:hypothetical protein
MGDPAMKYHHLGIPTSRKLRDEVHLEHLKIYVSGYGKSAYGIEWMRYEDDAPYPDLVKTVPHVAFEVEDLVEALRGRNVIIPPNSPSPGVQVAFIEDNGAPVEFLQIDRSIAEQVVMCSREGQGKHEKQEREDGK